MEAFAFDGSYSQLRSCKLKKVSDKQAEILKA